MLRLFSRIGLIALAMLAVTSTTAFAQSAIAGQVRDTSGGVLPGVTVEASSPALIEKTKSAVTDSSGQYNIIDLRPGTYAVTFTLTGFRSVRREGVEVPSNVTVPITVELAVGSLEETITVSGSSPVVDTRSAQRLAVLTRDTIDALPTSRAISSLGAVVPGVRLQKPDLGGTQAMQQIYGSAHGMAPNENSITVDGMDVRPNTDTAAYQQYFNPAMTQEMTYQLSGQTAETEQGGMRINIIPRDGGNIYSGEFFANGATSKMQASNLTPELKAQGLTSPSSISSMWDYNPLFAGPVKKDKMWFVISGRFNSVNTIPAGSHYADGSPGIEDQYVNYASARLTTQVSPKNKFVLYYDRAWKFKGHDMTDSILPGGGTAGGIDPATGAARRQPKLYLFGQAKWTSTVSSRLLLEAGFSVPSYARNGTCQEGTLFNRGTPEWYTHAVKFDFIRGTQTTSCSSDSWSIEHGQVPNAALSYVTGSHALKTGFSWKYGPRRSTTTRNADLLQRYRDGVPDSVQVYTSPDLIATYLNADMGVYVTDAWTLKRLTVTPGIRWNYVNASQEAATKGAGRFSKEITTPRIDNLPNWKDWTPRLSAAYDLFGTGNTAIKGSMGKYMRTITTSLAQRYSPFATSTDIRNWNDCAFLPGTSTCDPAQIGALGYHDDVAQDNEIGPSNNINFGIKPARSADPDLARVYSWQSSLSVQQQLIPGLSVLVAWYHLDTPNPEVSNNVAVGLNDYSSFQAPNPLGNGETITVFNLNKDKQGIVNTVDMNSTINKETYNGFEISANGRLPHGITVFGGWTAEQTVTVSCDTTDANKLRFCDQTGKTHQDLGKNVPIPYVKELKLNASYEAPYGIQIGTSFISYAGSQSPTNWVVPTALFAPVGGRTATVTLPLTSPGVDFLPRWGELDLSLKKTFTLPRRQSLQGIVEIFNLPNSATVLTVQQNFGTTLGNATSTIQGRLFKIGGRYRF